MWFFVGLMFLIFIFMGISIGITPFFSRQATPFGISVSKKYPFVERYKKRYALWNIALSIFISLPLFYLPFIDSFEQAEMIAAIYTLIAILLYMLFSFGLYLKYRKEILDWKQTLPKEEQEKAKKVIIDVNYHRQLKTRSNFSFLIWQVIIILIPIVFIFAFYDAIPNEIPINWDVNFEVNRTMEKSLWTILALPLFQVMLIPVFYYSRYSILVSKQKLSPLEPLEASAKSRHFRQVWSNFLFWMTLATQFLLSGLGLFSMFGQAGMGWIIFVITILYMVFVIGGTMYLSYKYGQAGEKLLKEDERYYKDTEEDGSWLWGVIYFNKEDPSIFVEKRFGIGPTLNLARYQAWLFVGGTILLMIVMILWSFTL